MTPTLCTRWHCLPQLLGALLVAMLGSSTVQAQTAAPTHENFDTAMHAVRALVAAAHSNDTVRLRAIFGPGSNAISALNT